MVELIFNEFEKKLLVREVKWYYGQFYDEELGEILKKNDWSMEECEKVKDMMRMYHQKTGLGNDAVHAIEAGIFKKFDEGFKIAIKSSEKKLLEQQRKEAEKKRKEAEKKRKEAIKAKEKAEKERLKKIADAKKKQAAERKAQEKAKYRISDVFADLTPKPKE